MPSKLPSVVIYLKPAIHEAVKARAAADQRSVSKWLALEIERAVTKRKPYQLPEAPAL